MISLCDRSEENEMRNLESKKSPSFSVYKPMESRRFLHNVMHGLEAGEKNNRVYFRSPIIGAILKQNTQL